MKDVYEKVQSRAGGGSSQRIAVGNIRISAASEGQIYGLEVYVQRLPEAALLAGEEIKRIPLQANHEAHFKNQVFNFRLLSHNQIFFEKFLLLLHVKTRLLDNFRRNLDYTVPRK